MNDFSTETSSKNMAFKTHRKSKSGLDQKLCQFLFFHCHAIFDKLSKLGQIYCVIPYYIKIKESLYMGRFFCQSSWKLAQKRKILCMA